MSNVIVVNFDSMERKLKQARKEAGAMRDLHQAATSWLEVQGKGDRVITDIKVVTK